MKTIFVTLILLFSLSVKSQITDIIYIPQEKSFVTSLKYNYTPIGLYAGGYITKEFPSPYYYTVPLSIFNRFGINLQGSKNRWAIMIGGKINNYSDKVIVRPDYWFKFYPLKTILNNPNGLDFVFAMNYDDNFSYGVGLSIQF